MQITHSCMHYSASIVIKKKRVNLSIQTSNYVYSIRPAHKIKYTWSQMGFAYNKGKNRTIRKE